MVAMVANRSLAILYQRHLYSCQAFIDSLKLEITSCDIRNSVLIGSGTLASLVFMRIGFVFSRIFKLRQQKVSLSQVPHLEKLAKLHGLTHQLNLIESTDQIAFCFGLSQPQVYISTQIVKRMSPKELEAIILHEKYHAEHHDSLTLFVASIMLMAFPFFPVLGNLIRNYRLRAELHADQAAITTQASKKHLLSVLRKMIAFPNDSSFGIAALADETLEMRIKHLLHGQPQKVQIPYASLGVSLSSVAILLSVIFMPSSSVALELPTQSTELCIGGSSCAIKCSATPATPMSIVEPVSSTK
jgi:beta-lactamase regulating signal transducer with metallopeptidase domain